MSGQVISSRSCLLTDDRTCALNPISRTDNTTEFKITADGSPNTSQNKSYWVISTTSTSQSYALNNRAQLLSEKTTTVNLLDTDNFGNIFKSVTQINNGFSVIEATTENVYAAADEPNWWINKLNSSTATLKTVSGAALRNAHAQLDPDKRIKTSYTWTANRLPDVVTVETLLGDSAKAKEVNTDYNDYGLPVTVTTKQPGTTESRYLNTTYSSDGYFINTVTDPLGQTTTTHTYPEHGQVKDVIDINGLMTRKSYDAFGRVEQVTPPTGTGQPAYSRFGWCQGGCDGNIDPDIQYKVTTYQAGSPTSTVYKDKFNRVLLSTTQDFSGDLVYAYIRYNALGQKTFESVPTAIQNDNQGIHYNGYDALGRLTDKTTDEAEGNQLNVTYSYNGFTASVNANGLNMSKTYSGTGQLMQTTDANSGVTKYAYDAMGNPIVLQDANGNPILAKYNALGQKEYVDDPNMGHKAFTYTAFGEVLTEKDANLDVLTYEYDFLGRLLKRYINGTEETAVTFNNSGQCKGTVQSETTGSDYQKTYSYDTACRPISVTTNIGGNSYTMETQYDGIYGRVKAVVYPNDLTIANLYNGLGYLTTVKNARSDYIYRQITSADVRGQYTTALEANGVIDKSASYDPVTGQMLQIDAATTLLGNQRHHIVYTYDSFGNLKTQDVDVSENGAIVHSTETYQYDGLQRLTQSSLNITGGADAGSSIINYAYDAVGNFTLKSDYVDSYTYGDMAKTTNNAGPNASRFITKSNGLTSAYSYDKNGNMTSGDGKMLAYNTFNKPVTISRAGITSTFSYGADLSRYRQVKTGLADGNETTIYIGKAYEQMTKGSVVTSKAYIGDIAVVTETIGGPEAGHKIGFIHRDRLGSVVTVTDENGNVVDNKSYDPFGKPRKGNQKKIDPLINPTLKDVVAQSNLINGTDYALYTNRGFTDHEHLDDAQLIHMNGRVYDYNLGRFLSVDPFIQAPGNSQSMNPYSYIMNNPLAGTDPSGYCTVSRIQSACDTTLSHYGGNGKADQQFFKTGENKQSSNGVTIATKTFTYDASKTDELLSGLNEKGAKLVTGVSNSDGITATATISYLVSGGTKPPSTSVVNGELQLKGVEQNHVTEIEYKDADGFKAIVLHQTGGSTVEGAMETFKKRKVGTHFIIGKDGKIYQTASLDKTTQHVGPKIKSRCGASKACSKEALKKVQVIRGIGNLNKHERTKPYPDRYPISFESIGIEVVARNLGASYEAPTAAQRKSLKSLVSALQSAYGLTNSDVFTHSEVSYKPAKEGENLGY